MSALVLPIPGGSYPASAILDGIGTTLGMTLYRGATVWQALVGNITTTRKFLRQVGNGAISAAPAWDTLAAGDIPISAALDTLGTTRGSLLYRNVTIWTTLAPSATVGAPLVSGGTGADVTYGDQAVNTTSSPTFVTVNGLVFKGSGGSGLHNVSIVTGALASLTTGVSNVAIGYNALNANTIGSYNVAIGEGALQTSTGVEGGQHGSYNTAVGYIALQSNTSGFSNDAFGEYTMKDVTTGSWNTGMGSASNRFLTIGSSNVALGHAALYNNLEGNQNTAVGQESGQGGVVGGSYSRGCFCGYHAGYSIAADNSCFFGYNAGALVSSGANNLLLGYQAGAAGGGSSSSLSTGSNNIVIGYNINAPLPGSNNTLTIGNIIHGDGIDGTGTSESSGHVSIGGIPTGAAKFEVIGSSKLNGTVNTVGVLTASSTVINTGGNGFVSTRTGSDNASLTLSCVASTGGGAPIWWQDTGSNKWMLGYNVSGVNFGLYDYTATAGMAFAFTAGSRNLRLYSTTDATNYTTAGVRIDGGLGVAKKIITNSDITTAAPTGGTAAAWKFGVLVTAASVFDTTRYIQLDVAGTLYKLAVCV